MDPTVIFMVIGFTLAAYAVVGNDSIQTLGTFLASNAHRPWWVLWIFAGSILVFTLVFGWFQYDGDVSYGRLASKFPEQEIKWFFVLPPLVLLFLTRFGLPVSTSFLILLSFQPGALGPMFQKSLLGYGVAAGVALLVYGFVVFVFEKRFRMLKDKPVPAVWIVLQWCSTGWLWFNWLRQDLANIYVYMPRQLPVGWLIFSIIIMVAMQGYIFSRRGGKIQQVVLTKTNTTDVRSATIIDFIYAMLLWYFKEKSDIPMSTTWVFLGLLAGRELGIRITAKIFESKEERERDSAGGLAQAWRLIGMDAFKAGIGLGISILLAWGIGYLLPKVG